MTDRKQPRPFYSVREAAELLRVAPATLYRAIREDAFPAVKIRSRCIIPSKALDALIEKATTSGRCVDVSIMMEDRRRERMASAVNLRGW